MRKNSALDLLLDELVGIPVFTVKIASDTISRSITAVTPAIERCVDSGIVKPVNERKRNRAFEVPAAISEFTLFERKLASPFGDTRRAKPARPVPSRLRL